METKAVYKSTLEAQWALYCFKRGEHCIACHRAVKEQFSIVSDVSKINTIVYITMFNQGPSRLSYARMKYLHTLYISLQVVLPYKVMVASLGPHESLCRELLGSCQYG